MTITKKELIELLNLDLTKEYAATIQYINHAAVMTGAKFGDIIKELLIHVDEEILHAKELANQIDFLGGDPTVDVNKIYTSVNNREMLKQDLDGEEDAIVRYQERIKQAEELGEQALAEKLRTILAVEQEHAIDLKQALGE